MIMENEKRILELLQKRKSSVETNIQNSGLFAQRLLDAFPVERDRNCEYFYPNTFDEVDGKDYLACREIFEHKNWNEVNFDFLFTKHVQFLILNQDGLIYYLPAFLKYFYDLRYLDSEFLNVIMGKLAQGLAVPTSDQLENAINERRYPAIKADYSAFECLDPTQSKLVAVFLINFANLLPSDWFDSKEAQRALTNYWGNFLLF